MKDEARKWVRTTGWLAAHLGQDTMPRCDQASVDRLSLCSVTLKAYPEVNYRL